MEKIFVNFTGHDLEWGGKELKREDNLELKVSDFQPVAKKVVKRKGELYSQTEEVGMDGKTYILLEPITLGDRVFILNEKNKED